MNILNHHDITTADGMNAAHAQLQVQLRETQHALVGLELIMLAQQALSGLVTTDEMVGAVLAKATGLPKLQVGDIDYLTCLVVKTN